MRPLMQLTIDGREVPHEVVALLARQSPKRLTLVQRTLLDAVREKGAVRSVEAGVIVHRHRTSACPTPTRGIGCCRYAGADGLAAMKRLMRRGLVYRDPDRVGRWLAT